MKKVLIALCAILAVATARVVITAATQDSPHLLGSNECTWGPSYWCENIKTAAGCNATKHCIKTKWETMTVPEDNDSVCDVCKQMVEQARNQLESNETQQDLKNVFEGSCQLIHIKPVVKECINLVDQFIPELVETLASQMNPNVVCSVAGLCNSAHIDKLLAEYEQSKVKKDGGKIHSLENDELEPDECSKCYTVATHMEHKLKDAAPDDFLKRLLTVCRELGSFSDACSSIVITHFSTIYEHTQANFNADNICHLSGQCAAKFHKHDDNSGKTPKVEIRPLSTVGMVEVDDDLPCKLCEQLVAHLRDLLVANTTEIEFEQVLKGLCKQTKSFSTECTAIVEEYYPEIYEYLTHGLNSNFVCQMCDLCPQPGKPVKDVPLVPWLRPKQKEIAVRVLKGTTKPKEIESGSEELSESEVESLQLPIERLVPFPALQGQRNQGKQSCALCEYILHYVQQAITDPVTEDKVKHAIEKVCNKLPTSLKGECSEFVETYGDAVVAILAQEIDPSQVCPMLHFCPSKELLEIWESAQKQFILEEQSVEDKPNCPLCLLAVTQIYNVIKNNKTEASIEAELDKLCGHLPHSLVDQCTDLVKGYSKELIELLLADLTPQEICVYIKLCDEQKDPGPTNLFVTDKDGEIITNEIPNYPIRPKDHPKSAHDKDVGCVICEFAMQYIDKIIGTKKNKDEIEKVVHGVCNHLPKTVSQECNHFVDEYADVVIDLLVKDMTPKEVCTVIGLCQVNEKQMRESIAECALCQAAISIVDKLLDDPKVDEDIENAVSKVCKYMPASKQNKCSLMIKVYGQSIINLFKNNADRKVICSEIALCSSNDYLAMAMKSPRIRRSYEVAKRCTWGISYWCSTNETARECKAVEHCKEKVWKAESAPALQQTTLGETNSSA